MPPCIAGTAVKQHALLLQVHQLIVAAATVRKEAVRKVNVRIYSFQRIPAAALCAADFFDDIWRACSRLCMAVALPRGALSQHLQRCSPHIRQAQAVAELTAALPGTISAAPLGCSKCPAEPPGS